MPSLPPLKTIRTNSSSPSLTPIPQALAQNTPEPEITPSVKPLFPGIPTNVNQLLLDIRSSDLIDSDAFNEFLTTMGGKTSLLSSRENAASALLQSGLLTEYQRDRILSGAIFGLVIGNYRVLERLSGGTVGIVFRAVHKTLKRIVAIKTVPADESTDKDTFLRFRTEMELLARIDHPNVVRILDAGKLDSPGPGLPALQYSVLENVPGGDLEQYVYNHGKQPIGVACEWGRHIAAGLAATHAHELVHRDVKPSNVLLTLERMAKVTDFGLARVPGSTLTPVPGLMGSLEFMAPEQVADPTTVTPAADVYGLGATLYWILTGQLPYPKSETAAKQIAAIKSGSPRRASEVLPSIPSELDQLIAKMMNRFPASRPTAVQVGRELAKFGDPIQLLPSELGHSISPEDATVMLGTSENGRLRTAVSHLTQLITTKTASVQDAARAVLTALSETARFSGELPDQQKRLQEYVRALSGALCRTSGWTQFSDSNYLEELLQCIPCRNIGFVAIPAQFLTKANPTQNEEREIEKHTIYGCEILEALRKKHAESLGFLRTAHVVVRSHHERWDGSGFPDGLIRDQIPHAARLIALAEGYDMLRGDLVDGTPGLSHEEAVEGLAQEARSMFDPEVVEAFIKCNHKFEEIYRLTADGGNGKER